MGIFIAAIVRVFLFLAVLGVVSTGLVLDAAKKTGLRVAKEVFADRAYENDGSLVNRRKSGAMITDEKIAIQRLIQMVKEKTVETIDGKVIPIEADSIFVHGDGEKALQFVKNIRHSFNDEGIEIIALNELLK